MTSELLPLWIFSKTYQISENAICPRYAGGQLTIKRKSIINIKPFAISRQQQTTILRLLARIVRFYQCLIVRVPFAHESMATLFFPSVKVRFVNFVRPRKHGSVWIKELNLGAFVYNFLRIAA